MTLLKLNHIIQLIGLDGWSDWNYQCVNYNHNLGVIIRIQII